jgi:transposase
MSLELSDRQWKLTCTTGLGDARYRRSVPAWAFTQLLAVMTAAKRRFHLAADAAVRSCYEAGREGFALHRFLVTQGIDNHVIDPASLRVDRRARRVKTDRVDGDGLVVALRHWLAGDRDALRVVRVPTREAEAARLISRELAALRSEATRYTNQMRALLQTQGVRLSLGRQFLTQLSAARDCTGEPLAAILQARLTRLWERRAQVLAQVTELERTTRAAIQQDTLPAAAQVRQLQAVRGIGLRGSLPLVQELFGWRELQNRRAVGGYLGLGGTPFQSGDHAHDQGIGKHGNRHARRVLIPLAWGWLRFQPTSELSRWFEQRFAHGGPAQRRRGIVALARRLAIALWRYLRTGVVPAGAVLKTA